MAKIVQFVRRKRKRLYEQPPNGRPSPLSVNRHLPTLGGVTPFGVVVFVAYLVVMRKSVQIKPFSLM